MNHAITKPSDTTDRSNNRPRASSSVRPSGTGVRRFVGRLIPDDTEPDASPSNRQQDDPQQYQVDEHSEKTIKRPGQSKTKDFVLRRGSRDNGIVWWCTNYHGLCYDQTLIINP